MDDVAVRVALIVLAFMPDRSARSDALVFVVGELQNCARDPVIEVAVRLWKREKRFGPARGYLSNGRRCAYP